MDPESSDRTAIGVFQTAVDAARRSMEQSLAGGERIGDAVDLKLTLDLSNQSLRNIPDEVVEIIRRDVERCDRIHLDAL